MSLLAGPVLSRDRLPPLAPDQPGPEQSSASEAFLAARKVPVFGPTIPLLRSPELMTSARSMGDYLRYKSSLPQRISKKLGVRGLDIKRRDAARLRP